MKKLKPIILSITLLIFAAGSVSEFDPSIIFTSETIDPQGNGDAKALADIDGDGTMNPILGGSNLGWYSTDSIWSFHEIASNPPFIEFSTDMQAADIDNDGDPDVIVGNAGGTNNLIWFENPRINPPTGSGNDPTIAANWSNHIIGTHGDWVHDIEIGDLDNDGKLDIISSGHGFTHIWKNDLPFGWIDIQLSNAGKGVFIGDINSDGWKDIATPFGWLANPTVTILNSWEFYPISVSAPNDEVLLADINGDSRLDLITIDAHGPSEFAWYKSPSDPTLSSWIKTIIDGSMGAHKLEAADFNNDGFVDILVGLELDDLSIYFNSTDSMGIFTKQQLDTKAAHNARAGDIDNDGDIDVFGADYAGHPPSVVYFNESVVPVELTSFTYAVSEGTVVLNWTTVTETNNSHFIVQRSYDNISFMPIARIEGNGTTSEISKYSYADDSLENGLYFYRLKQVDYDGSYSYSQVIEVRLGIPINFYLAQNFPNPFNPNTIIEFQITEASFVSLRIFDPTGGEVANLVSDELSAGKYKYSWDASNLSSGVYIYQLDAGNYFETKKMILLK